jgi:hypothetical protein
LEHVSGFLVGAKVRLIFNSCNNAMEFLNLRPSQTRMQAAFPSTSGFSRVQKRGKTEAKKFTTHDGPRGPWLQLAL